MSDDDAENPKQDASSNEEVSESTSKRSSSQNEIVRQPNPFV
jgi:hypothetical protein